MKLAVVIVNYNGANFVLNSIRSIYKYPATTMNSEIVVVDNASLDNSLEVLNELISSYYPEKTPVKTRIISKKENLGFGKANNIAFAEVDADFYFLLNPDAEVKSGTIDKLVEYIQTEKKIGVVAPQVLDEHGNRIGNVWSDHKGKLVPFFINTFGVIRLLPKKNQRQMNFRGADANQPTEVDIVSGAAMLLTKETVIITKGFDKDFFMYGEDIDLSMRIRSCHKKIIFLPEAHVVHQGGKSSSTIWTNIERDRVMTEAKICLWRKHYTRRKVRLFLAISAVVYFIKYLYIRFRTFGKQKYDVYKIYFSNLRK